MDTHNQEPGYAKEDISNKKIAVYGLISVALMVILIVAVSQVFLNDDDSLIPKKERPYIPLKELRSHEDSVLYSYKLLDNAKNIYRIPVDSAVNILDQEKHNVSLDPSRK